MMRYFAVPLLFFLQPYSSYKKTLMRCKCLHTNLILTLKLTKIGPFLKKSQFLTRFYPLQMLNVTSYVIWYLMHYFLNVVGLEVSKTTFFWESQEPGTIFFVARVGIKLFLVILTDLKSLYIYLLKGCIRRWWMASSFGPVIT